MYVAGGRGLVELTIGGLKPDPEALVKIAEASGVQIIMGCGHYVEEYQDPDNANRSVDSFAEEMIEQVTVGAWGTKVRAGIIGEIGCQYPWTEQERRVMQGAIVAQKETGVSINVHPGRRTDQPQEIAEFFLAQGAPTDRLIISHIDRTIFDIDTLLKLADTGCVIEFDLFGWEQSSYPMADIDMPNDGARIKLIKALVDKGYARQVVISHDICTKVRLGRYGGHGYRHIFAHVMPLMAARGISQADIETIMVHNPRQLLAFA
jgi:phosphotriesterase-related protein